MSVTVQYAPLLTFSLRHGYYSDGVARSLGLHPTDATRRILALNNCRLRSAVGQLSVWYADKGAQSAARDMNADTILSFRLNSDDPQFGLITQPDWGKGDLIDGCLYFSNKSQITKTPLTLPSSKAVVLPVRSRQFSAPAGNGALTLVRWITGTKVWTGPNAGPRPTPIDLSDAPDDGRYLLKAGAATLLDFYLTNAPAQTFLGALEFGWSNTAFARPADLPRDLTLGFAPRLGAWTYYITSQNEDMPLNQAVIKDATGGKPFRAAKAVRIRGQSGFSFTSIKPLALAERYGTDRRLTLDVPAFGMRIPDPITLPMASPAGMQKVADKDGLGFAVYVSL